MVKLQGLRFLLPCNIFLLPHNRKHPGAEVEAVLPFELYRLLAGSLYQWQQMKYIGLKGYRLSQDLLPLLRAHRQGSTDYNRIEVQYGALPTNNEEPSLFLMVLLLLQNWSILNMLDFYPLLRAAED